MDSGKPRYAGGMPGYDQSGLVQGQGRIPMGMRYAGNLPQQMHMHDGGMGSGGFGVPQRSMSGIEGGNPMMLNRSGSTGYAQSAPFDMSDFPSLSQSRGDAGSSQPYSLHRSDFSIQNEDFPALGGSSSGNGSNSGDPDANRLQSQFFSQQQRQGLGGAGIQQQQPRMPQQMFMQQQGGYPLESNPPAPTSSTSTTNVPSGYVGLKPVGKPAQQQQPGMIQQKRPMQNGFDSLGVTVSGMDQLSSNQQTQPQQVKPGVGGNKMAGLPSVGVQGQQPKKRSTLPPEQQFGLLGLLGVIRMEDPDRVVLALGTDLTSLGLNLNSSESLHTSFASPWSDRPSPRDPQFNLPACYNITSKGPNGNPVKPSLKPALFAKLQLESLFYVFYAMPRDIAQVLAAQELYNREWRYHMEHKVWFSQVKDAQTDIQQQPQFLYFDVPSWEARPFNNPSVAATLQTGFMPANTVLSLGSNSTSQQPVNGAPTSTPVAT